MIKNKIHFDIDIFKSGWMSISILCESEHEIDELLKRIHYIDETIEHSSDVKRAQAEEFFEYMYFWCSPKGDDGYYIDCCPQSDAFEGDMDCRFADIIWDDICEANVSKESLMEFL